MTKYNLFRVKFVPSYQLPLFPSPPEANSTSAVFVAAMSHQPSIPRRQGATWHIGNLTWISEIAGSCAIGKTTHTTVEKFDEESRTFDDEPLDASPYTTIVFDAGLGLAAIAQKTRLGSNKAVASRFAELLNSAPPVQQFGLTALIDPIHDPDSFIRKLQQSLAILKFRAWFTGPNPIDADELFQRPLSVYAKAVRADRGSVAVEGTLLDVVAVSAVARSTAATGNEATARIVGADEMKATIKLSGDQIALEYPTDECDAATVLADVTKRYERVRHGT
jgi:hypothetical protein